jgi:outer membrane protein OmpA-like peptidoglycan-associated protein
LKLQWNSRRCGRPAPPTPVKNIFAPAAGIIASAVAVLALATLALVLTAPLACGPKTAKRPPSTTRMSGEAQRDQAFLVPLKQQQRWAYGETKPALSSKPAYLLRSINFEENGSSLDAEASGVCRDFAKVMAEKPKVRILLLGLADAYGEKLNAENLGLLRARATREFLGQQGVAKDRMEMATIGSAGAVAKPDEKIAQSLDRRVEIWLIEE